MEVGVGLVWKIRQFNVPAKLGPEERIANILFTLQWYLQEPAPTRVTDSVTPHELPQPVHELPWSSHVPTGGAGSSHCEMLLLLMMP